MFPLFKRWLGEKFYPVLRGGAGGGVTQNVSDVLFSHFVTPPPDTNDQSLKVRGQTKIGFLSCIHYSLKLMFDLVYVKFLA